jgi:hypothetical protein
MDMKKNVIESAQSKIRGTSSMMLYFDDSWDNKKKDIPEACKKCMEHHAKNKALEGHLMTLSEMEELKIEACDILYMTHNLGMHFDHKVPTITDADHDTGRRIVYFIPGKESKYFKPHEESELKMITDPVRGISYDARFLAEHDELLDLVGREIEHAKIPK